MDDTNLYVKNTPTCHNCWQISTRVQIWKSIATNRLFPLPNYLPRFYINVRINVSRWKETEPFSGKATFLCRSRATKKQVAYCEGGSPQQSNVRLFIAQPTCDKTKWRGVIRSIFLAGRGREADLYERYPDDSFTDSDRQGGSTDRIRDSVHFKTRNVRSGAVNQSSSFFKVTTRRLVFRLQRIERAVCQDEFVKWANERCV